MIRTDVDLGSFLRGLLAMRSDRDKSSINVTIKRNRGWWLILWTPVWHEGRGPYVSVGVGWFAIYRGY